MSMPMNEHINGHCDHRWDNDSAVRICLNCGQIRTFSRGQENPRIIWPERGINTDPLQLPQHDKALVAGLAKGRIKTVEKLTGIPMHILRAWVGAYCRAKSRNKAATTANPPTIILQRFTQADCFICDGPLFGDNKWTPHFLETPTGKVWLCGVCADGVKRLLDLVGIRCQITEGTPNE